jgi:hypothetical protein
MASVKAQRCSKLVAFGAKTLAESLQEIAKSTPKELTTLLGLLFGVPDFQANLFLCLI